MKGRTEAERRGRNDCVFVAGGKKASGEGEGAGRWMGCGVRLGKHSLLFASLFPFFSQGQTEIRASCSCLSVCARAGEVDLSGLYISSRESPPTNLPPGALVHWPPSLLPWDPQAAPQPPATSLILSVMRTPRRGDEEGARVCVRKTTLENTTMPPTPPYPSPSSLISSPCASIFLLQGHGAAWAVKSSPSCCCSICPEHMIFRSSGQAVENKGGWDETTWML